MTSPLALLKASVPVGWKRRIKQAMGFQDMETRLVNLRRAGFACTGAVDVGAYRGEWAALAHACWQCPVLAVEPQPEPLSALQRLASRVPMAIEIVALSDRAGRMAFRLDETNSGLATAADEAERPCIEVEVERLDAVLIRHPGLRPNLIKIDVQGAELAVLEGAGDALRRFEVVILEVSLIRIGPVPVFGEVVQWMGERGYRLYDFLPMYYRPRDGALWQGDAFFVRDDSPLVSSLSWS